MAPTISRATLADARAIAKVHVLAWQWAYRGVLPATLLDSLDPSARERAWSTVLSDDASSGLVVARDGKAIVGFAHCGPSRDDDALADTGEVTAIYLLPDYFGTGVGYRLWTTALEQLRRAGHGQVTVWVLDTNVRGRSFYERIGLQLDGATKHEDRSDCTLRELRYRGEVATP